MQVLIYIIQNYSFIYNYRGLSSFLIDYLVDTEKVNF